MNRRQAKKIVTNYYLGRRPWPPSTLARAFRIVVRRNNGWILPRRFRRRHPTVVVRLDARHYIERLRSATDRLREMFQYRSGGALTTQDIGESVGHCRIECDEEARVQFERNDVAKWSDEL